jgi:hypothetical protein
VTAAAVDTVTKRIEGERPSRPKALFAATVAAVAAGVVTYKLLRAE